MPAWCAAAKASVICNAYVTAVSKIETVWRDLGFQRFAIHIFHGDETRSGVLVDVVDVNDIGMVQGRSGFSLLHKPSHSVRIRDLVRRQHLHRYQAVQVCVIGLVNNPHATAAELFEDAIVRQYPPYQNGYSKTPKCQLSLSLSTRASKYSRLCTLTRTS